MKDSRGFQPAPKKLISGNFMISILSYTQQFPGLSFYFIRYLLTGSEDYQMKFSHFLSVLSSAVVLVTFELAVSQSNIALDACNYLAEENFTVSRVYTGDEKHRYQGCDSLRKPVDKGEPLGSDLRYSVRGNASVANYISLTLRMNSAKVSTPVLREFHKYSDVIYRKAFSEPLPAEISRAILSAIRGEWQFNNHTIRLKRMHDRALVYELVFSIGK